MANGDITYTQRTSALDAPAFSCGIYTADASESVNINVGFVPTMIELHVKDTGATTIDQVIQWWNGMTAGYWWKTLMSSGAITLETSGGPTLYGNTSDDAYGDQNTASFQGFTIPAGLPASLADGDTIYWKAWR